MAEPRRVSHETPDPVVAALAALVRTIHAKRHRELAERRATMSLVEGGKRRGGSAGWTKA